MLTDILFPKLCLGCGFLGGYICKNCWEKLLVINKDTCLYCGKASLFGYTHPKCLKDNGVSVIISGYYYGPTLKKIIKAIKYRLVKEAVPELFNQLNDNFVYKIKNCIEKKKRVFFQPIPQSKTRFNERGFNFAELLSNYIFKIVYNNTNKGDFLIRGGNPLPQAQIKEKEKRIKNILGSFSVKKLLPNVTIFLVDDVVTSGATVKEATRGLKDAGAKEVGIISLARG